MNLIGKRTRRVIRKIIRDEMGSEMLEFALSATIFFTIVFGIADMCRAMYAWNFASFAAQQGARYAMVRGATWPSWGAKGPREILCNVSSARPSSSAPASAAVSSATVTRRPCAALGAQRTGAQQTEKKRRPAARMT